MEVREYHGVFVTGGVETEEMALRVILSTSAGVVSGSGSFALPAALVGMTDERLSFRTREGAELTLVVREVDRFEGAAYFLTEGRLPELRRAQRA